MTDTKTQSAVGIDLGTTFSAVAYLDSVGRPETIRNSEGDLTTPSAVFFDQKRPIVGVEAVEAGLLEPDRLAQFAKRDVGEAFYDKEIRGKHLPAEVIQALILRKLKADAELKLGHIEQAVITVPAFFNEPCRKATQDAGRLAGLTVLDIINEPTAAAITYGVHQGFLGADGNSKESETVLVYDLGGGTFDVTVMQIEKGNFNTIATAGDVYLGGIDWDNRIVDFIAESFQNEHGSDPRKDPQATQELLRKANQAKHALTQRESVTIAFAHDGRRLRTEFTQQGFNDRCADLVERTLMTVQLVLDDADKNWSDLTRLILVGGSTRMPMIRNELQRLSDMELDRSLSPDEAVSHGAALYAGMLMAGKQDKSGISVSNVNSHDLGILAVEPQSGKPRRQIMIPRNSRLPARKMVRFRTHKDNQANVKIEIVEGGDDRGINATKIGKCVVDDLPRGTPKGTNVDVQFDYRSDGRVTVRASLPEIDRKITMTLNRASGLTDEDIKTWSARLDETMSDAMLADLPSIGGQSTDATQTVSDDELSGDVAADAAPKKTTGSATRSATATESVAAMTEPLVDNTPPAKAEVIVTGKDAPQKAMSAGVLGVPPGIDVRQPSESGQNRSQAGPSINIDLGDTASAPEKLSSLDVNQLPAAGGNGSESISEKPKLELDPRDTSSSAKADSTDLAMLSALAGQSAERSASQSDLPSIVTELKTGNSEPSEPGKRKKSGGLFGRRKK